jgi:2-pyrone-4,6-dicarboxylate lactonase
MQSQRHCPPPHSKPSRPALDLPIGACDAHCHVFGPAAKFPFSLTRAYTPEDAPAERLEALHELLGISNAVYVQASCHGFDNSAMLDAISRKPATRRGVCIVPTDIDTARLSVLDRQGVRGARLNFMTRLSAAPDRDAVTELAGRIADLGWHLVVHFDPDMLPDLADWLIDLPLPVVIDHMGRMSASDIGSTEMKLMLRMLENEKIWCKISGAERSSETGAPWHDIVPLTHGILEVAPERVLWGTDWPHPVLDREMPDDGKLVDLIATLMPAEALRRQVLVENPKRLYGFE